MTGAALIETFAIVAVLAILIFCGAAIWVRNDGRGR